MNLEFSNEAQSIGNRVFFLVILALHEYSVVCNDVRFEKLGSSYKIFKRIFSLRRLPKRRYLLQIANKKHYCITSR